MIYNIGMYIGMKEHSNLISFKATSNLILVGNW